MTILTYDFNVSHLLLMRSSNFNVVFGMGSMSLVIVAV